MSAQMVTRFAHDPVAPDSAQFPLGRPLGMADNTDPASGEGVRPWGLRGMSTLSSKTVDPLPAWRYDHKRQIAVDLDGVALYELGWTRQRTRYRTTMVTRGPARTGSTTSPVTNRGSV